MLLGRLQDLSVYYYIKDLFVATPFINVVDAFPTMDLVIPTIAIETKRIDLYPFEMGNRHRIRSRAWYIDVFAQNKTQRDEFSETILDALEDCIPVYDYNAGFPPTIVTKLGCLDTESLRMDIVRIMPQLVDKLYWRSSISFTAVYNKI